MERRLRGAGKPSASRFLLGPVLVLSLLAVQASCHCAHRVPSGREVVHHVYLKPERLAKRSSPDDLQLKIKIIYDSSVDHGNFSRNFQILIKKQSIIEAEVAAGIELRRGLPTETVRGRVQVTECKRLSHMKTDPQWTRCGPKIK